MLHQQRHQPWLLLRFLQQLGRCSAAPKAQEARLKVTSLPKVETRCLGCSSSAFILITSGPT